MNSNIDKKIKDTIFISHATPEDNEFAIWLASRLQLIGYKVWIDKEQLLGGEKFWETIGKVIRNEACQFLMVYSQNICVNGVPDSLKDGISKEFSLAETVAKKSNFTDFILLLNIDKGASYDLFIGADRLNQISFYNSWAEGLKMLIKKLKKQNVPQVNPVNIDLIGPWYENEYTTKSGIKSDKKELYYSSWWKISKLPPVFYIHHFANKTQAKVIYEIIDAYPSVRMANNITTFCEHLPNTVEKDGEIIKIEPQERFEIKLADVLTGFESMSFPTWRDTQNHFKRLLHRVFHELMKAKGLYWYELANKKQAYFYPLNKPHTISFEYYYRPQHRKKKRKSLIGKYLSLGKWHFAVSSKAILTPHLAYSLKTHITFTSNGFQVWEDANQRHTHRRKKGRTIYNEGWRDLLYAFIIGLKDGQKNISIALNDRFALNMPEYTDIFWADFGYWEPNDVSRQDVLLDDYIEDEKNEDELTE